MIKSKNKKIFKVVAFLSLIFSFSVISNIQKESKSAESVDFDKGLTINSENDRYALKNITTDTIRTYEAWVETYETGVNQGSTIFANYSDEWLPGTSFRIYTYGAKKGMPQLNLRYQKSTATSGIIQKQYTIETNICGTGKRHVAFTISNTQIKGYLDGVLKNTWSYNGTLPDAVIPYCIGGDGRPENSWWFRGTIYNLAAYSTVKSASQITQDMDNPVTKTSDLVAGWNFDSSMKNIADNGNEITNPFYKDDFTNPDQYDYTFAVVGDTQSLMYKYPGEFHNIYDCILDKKDDMKIELVMGLGDIVEMNYDSEWKLAREQIYRLSGQIPYTIVRGNHDLSNYGGQSDEWRLVKYGQYFDNDTYRRELSGLYQNSPENAYKLISVCGVDYLILALDYGASDEVLSWANEVVASFPNHNVIVTTHAFLFRDGTTLDQTDLVPPAKKWGYNNGDDIWEKFISKHENIKLVLCGHDPHPDIVRSEFIGDNGNIVNCLLVDPQYVDFYYGAYGLVAFFHFSNGGKDVSIEYYSTVTGEFFKECNQLSFSLDNYVSKNEETHNLNFFKYVESNEVKNGDKISFVYKNNLVDVSLSYSDGAFSYLNNKYENNLLQDEGNRLIFELEAISDKFLLKSPSGKYLCVNENDLVLSNSGTQFEIAYDNGFVIKAGNKYLTFDEGFKFIESPSKIKIYAIELYDENPLEEALRYFNRFNNSYICGFDDNTSALSEIFTVLKDDYSRLSSEAKLIIHELIENDDQRAKEFVTKYERILYLHLGEEGFDNFIDVPINNSLNYWHQKVSTDNYLLIIIASVFGAISVLFVVILQRKKFRFNR